MFAEIVVDLLNNNTDKTFDYKIPEKLLEHVEIGIRVSVPFGPKVLEGYVVGIKKTTDLEPEKVKNIIGIIDSKPIVLGSQLYLMNKLKTHLNIRAIDSLRLFVPSSIRSNFIKAKIERYAKVSQKDALIEHLEKTQKNATKKIALLTYLANNESELHREAFLNKNFLADNVRQLKDLGYIEIVEKQVERAPEFEVVEDKRPTLTPEQCSAINKILHGLDAKTQDEKNFLLFGVTGSGKTEVYLGVIEEVLERGKTAIVLVPEISLTPQIFSRFKSRFGSKVAIIHSGLSEGERFDEWNRILSGEATVVVGARSAIFSPIKNIGVIILDEEHDASYQSESNPRYHAQDAAKFLAEYYGAVTVLGSATPSIENFYRTTKEYTNKAPKNLEHMGEYYKEIKKEKLQLIELPARVNNINMPSLEIVDMAEEIRAGNNSIFSRRMTEGLEHAMKANKQAIVFINRRGFSSFLRCIDCGHVPKCESCDVSLVWHKEESLLKCHYCAKKFKKMEACFECKSTRIRLGGVGTERVCEELQEKFPDAKIFRMDNDTTKQKNAHFKILDDFKNSKKAILVGTQMISKGHDFSGVDFVGVVDADLSLYVSDYKSTERTYQLISQVAGRAGRVSGEGVVVVQSYNPKHFVFRFLKEHDYKGFYQKEINMREATTFPPFSNIARVLITSENDDKASYIIKNMFPKIKALKDEHFGDFIYLEAMKSPIKRIEDKYRYQILMRVLPHKADEIYKQIFIIKAEYNHKDAFIFFEINPQNLS
ncbi:MAG: primosomal protein N' [Firmicutes bacterium]|nr:primosomal protein N' [Bacillota bacterium]